MGVPYFLAENFFNLDLFTDHTVAAEEETSGYEAWRVGTVRRHPRNYWTPTTNNSETWVGVTCDRVRWADTIFIDRNNNLAGATITLKCSNDNWSSSETAFTCTFPSQIFRGSRLDELPGALNEEGAWGHVFDGRVAKYWRLYVAAMGAGIRPQIGGVYLGMGFQAPTEMLKPGSDESWRLAFQEQTTAALWSASNRKAQRKESGSYPIRFRVNDLEYDEIRYHLGGLFWAGRHMWIVPDMEEAERAVLTYAPPGVYGASKAAGSKKRLIQVDWVEYNPVAN